MVDVKPGFSSSLKLKRVPTTRKRGSGGRSSNKSKYIYVPIDDIKTDSSGRPVVNVGTKTYGSVDEYRRSSGGRSNSSDLRRLRADEAKRLEEQGRIAAENKRIAEERGAKQAQQDIIQKQQLESQRSQQLQEQREKLTWLQRLKKSGAEQQAAFDKSAERKYEEEQALRHASFGSLLQSGNAPLAIVKGSREFIGSPIAEVSSEVKEAVTGQELTSEQKRGVEKFVGETALFAGLAPATQTTSQLLVGKKPVEVKFKGVQTQTGDDLMRSEAAFITSTNRKGVVEAIGKTVKQGDDVAQTVGIVRGKTFENLFTPLGKRTPKVTQEFFGIEGQVSQQIPIDDVLVQKSIGFGGVGKPTKGGKIVDFEKGISASVSLTKDQKTVQLTKTLTEQGDDLFSGGLLVNRNVRSSSGERIVGGGTSRSVSTQDFLEQSIQKTTTQALQPKGGRISPATPLIETPTSLINPTGRSSQGTRSSLDIFQERVSPFTPVTQKPGRQSISPYPLVQTDVASLVESKPRTRGRGKTRTSTRQKQDFAQLVELKQPQVQKSPQKARTSTRQTFESSLVPQVRFGPRLSQGFYNFPLDIPNRRRSPQVQKRRQVRRRTPQRFVSQLTGFEAALGLGGRKVKQGSFTGFEVTRGSPIDFNAANKVALNAFAGAGRRPVRRRPAARKKVSKKTTKKKKKGTDWINSLY